MCVLSMFGANVLGTSVLEYCFCGIRWTENLVVFQSTCTHTCTRVLLKMKVILKSTSILRVLVIIIILIQNGLHNHKSSSWS